MFNTKCPHCGKNVQVDDGSVFAVCEHCAQSFTVEYPKENKQSKAGAGPVRLNEGTIKSKKGVNPLALIVIGIAGLAVVGVIKSMIVGYNSYRNDIYDYEPYVGEYEDEDEDESDYDYDEKTTLMKSLDEMSEDGYARVGRKAIAELKEEIENEKGYDFLHRDPGEMTPAGYYLLTAKDSDTYPGNILYCVYEVEFPADKAEDKNAKDEKVYMTVTFRNIELRENGDPALSYTWPYVEGDSVYIGDRFAENNDMITGYNSEEQMYDSVITDQSDAYYYEMSENLTDYANAE